MWHRPLRVICRTLCRAGPACPAGISAYCAAGHMGPALRIIPRPLRCRASPTGGRRGGRPCPPAGDGALDVPAGRCGISPYGRFAAPSVGRGPRAPPGSMHIARRGTWVPPYESYCAPFGAEHHRQADVGADDPVRPNSAKRCHSEPVRTLALESVPLVPYLLTTSRPSDQTETMLCRCVM